MGKFLGELKPVYNRWVWPFVHMEDGDWFIVSWEHRPPEDVRHLASVRAAQLGKRISVEKRPKDYPGFTKVTCGGRQALPERDETDPETINGIIRRLYAVDYNRIKWTMMDRGEVEEHFAEREGQPVQQVHCVWIPHLWRFIVELLPDRLKIERIDENDTLARWRKRKMAELLD